MWRTQAGLSREELGDEANYDAEYVKSMEQGRRRRRCACSRSRIRCAGPMVFWRRRTSI
ncbi:hypothetical protein ACFYWU_32855 [Streptomyces chrestomyceticus]|uniref:hypothetical protein n=1 Tax=Streptomyces chrestomyceticus TaxID=68185 RepID=UPI0036B3F9D6